MDQVIWFGQWPVAPLDNHVTPLLHSGEPWPGVDPAMARKLYDFDLKLDFAADFTAQIPSVRHLGHEHILELSIDRSTDHIVGQITEDKLKK